MACAEVLFGKDAALFAAATGAAVFVGGPGESAEKVSPSGAWSAAQRGAAVFCVPSDVTAWCVRIEDGSPAASELASCGRTGGDVSGTVDQRWISGDAILRRLRSGHRVAVAKNGSTFFYELRLMCTVAGCPLKGNRSGACGLHENPLPLPLPSCPDCRGTGWLPATSGSSITMQEPFVVICRCRGGDRAVVIPCDESEREAVCSALHAAGI